MDKIEVAKLRAVDILSQYGVSNWDILVTNSRKTLAVADHATKLVELSKRFILQSTIKDFDGIMHHEIAHILAGPGKGHGEEFVRICKEITSDAAFSCSNYPLYIGLYLYTCPNCGVIGTHEKEIPTTCVRCLSEVVITKNKIRTVEWASTP